jgi:hypothetical protein
VREELKFIEDSSGLTLIQEIIDNFPEYWNNSPE